MDVKDLKEEQRESTKEIRKRNLKVDKIRHEIGKIKENNAELIQEMRRLKAM